MQEIEITIEANGDVKIEGKGFTGNECTALTKAIEDALGTVSKRELKREYGMTKSVQRKAGA